MILGARQFVTARVWGSGLRAYGGWKVYGKASGSEDLGSEASSMGLKTSSPNKHRKNKPPVFHKEPYIHSSPPTINPKPETLNPHSDVKTRNAETAEDVVRMLYLVGFSVLLGSVGFRVWGLGV